MSKIKAWLGHNRWLVGITAVAALLRFWQLGSLPPGLTSAEANNGLAGLNLLHHGQAWSYGLTPLNAMYSWLSAPWLLVGHSLLTLRLTAALAGLITVIFTYLWLSQIRDKQSGLIGAAVVATLAWALSLSRAAEATSLIPAVVAVWLFLADRAGTSARGKYALAAWSGLGMYVIPDLWWLWAGALIWLVWQRRLVARADWKAAFLWVILIAPGIVWAVLHAGQVRPFFDFAGGLERLGQFLVHTVAAGGDWQLTAGSQPLLNAFYAIMAVLGLVVGLLRWRTSRSFLLVFAAGLLAGFSSPDGNGFALVLVPMTALVVTGITTMLEWWYATFPINAAARTSGRTAVGLILALAAYQGYVQYFVAYAASSQTYAAYREDAWTMGLDAAKHPGSVVVCDLPARSVIDYRAYPGKIKYATVKQLKDTKATYFVIGYAQRAEAERILAGTAPGGKLRAHTSDFDGRELYYTYETSK